MSQLVATIKSQEGQFSGANESLLIGATELGVWVPANALVTRFVVTAGTGAFTSGGLATVGFTLVNLVTPQTITLFAPSAYTLFSGGSFVGVDFNANPFFTLADSEVYINIAVANLTAGNCVFLIEYNEQPRMF